MAALSKQQSMNGPMNVGEDGDVHPEAPHAKRSLLEGQDGGLSRSSPSPQQGVEEEARSSMRWTLRLKWEKPKSWHGENEAMRILPLNTRPASQTDDGS
jgi:hypothetical protein